MGLLWWLERGSLDSEDQGGGRRQCGGREEERILNDDKRIRGGIDCCLSSRYEARRSGERSKDEK